MSEVIDFHEANFVSLPDQSNVYVFVHLNVGGLNKLVVPPCGPRYSVSSTRETLFDRSSLPSTSHTSLRMLRSYRSMRVRN
ncbi:hypothetical protein GBAR_LOCUS7010, partial [Geodia barretti]